MLDTVRELVGVVSWLLSLSWEKAMTLRGEVEADGIDNDGRVEAFDGVGQGLVRTRDVNGDGQDYMYGTG